MHTSDGLNLRRKQQQEYMCFSQVQSVTGSDIPWSCKSNFSSKQVRTIALDAQLLEAPRYIT